MLNYKNLLVNTLKFLRGLKTHPKKFIRRANKVDLVYKKYDMLLNTGLISKRNKFYKESGHKFHIFQSMFFYKPYENRLRNEVTNPLFSKLIL